MPGLPGLQRGAGAYREVPGGSATYRDVLKAVETYREVQIGRGLLQEQQGVTPSSYEVPPGKER